jgi:2-oxo-3-hexenedioate decarboxylase
VDNSTIEAIATDLMQARQLASPVERPSKRGLSTLHDGYRIARVMLDARRAAGDRVIGAKLGFTNPAVWSSVGLDGPLWAPVFEASYAESAREVTLPKLRAPEVEPEIVFGLRTDVDRDAPIEARIAWYALGLEVIDTGYPPGPPIVADQAADLCAHQFLIVGEPAPFSATLAEALGNFNCELYCDGQLKSRGAGRDVMGNPLHAADWFMKHLIDAVPLSTTSTVVLTTGRLGPPPAVPAGVSQWQLQATLPVPKLDVTIRR